MNRKMNNMIDEHTKKRDELVRIVASMLDDIEYAHKFDICIHCKTRVYEMVNERGLMYCPRTYTNKHVFKQEVYENKITAAKQLVADMLADNDMFTNI